MNGNDEVHNKVYLGSFLQRTKNIPDNHYDIVIADPWYGIGMTKNDATGFAQRRFRGEESGVDDSAPPKEEFDEIRRISKEQIIWGGNYFLDHLGSCRAPIVWDKVTGANYFADGEMAWTSFQTGCLRIFKHQWCGAFKDSERGQEVIHPCQKPVALYEWLIDRFVKPGWKVFSPYVGSGSDRIAAYNKRVWFEGCEIYMPYWKKQEDRFAAHRDPDIRFKQSVERDLRETRQQNLFT